MSKDELKKRERWGKAQKSEAEYFKHSGWRGLAAHRPEPSHPIAHLPVDSEFFRDKNILAIGCDPASTVHYINNAKMIIGIEPLAYHWRNYYEKSTVEHVAGIGEALPFRDKTFDVVVSLNVLDHVIWPELVIREASRVLRDGGTLLLRVNLYPLPGIIRSLLPVVDRSHPHHFSKNDVRRLLESAGLTIYYQYFYRPHSNRFMSALGNALSLLARAEVSAAIKRMAIPTLRLEGSAFACRKRP